MHLIEASAGTGKTFTLAHLVLRLVGERQLSLRALLVVTFTKAAAAELRDRIGRRLQQAQQLLQTPDPAGHEGLDQELKEWLGSIPPQNYERLRAQLLLALEELDAADITTIHGFCHRSLQRQALEAGLAPEVELENDGALLQEQVVHDYWQQQVLPLPAHALRGLISKGVQIEALQSLLATLEGDPTLASPELPPRLGPRAPPARPVARPVGGRLAALSGPLGAAGGGPGAGSLRGGGGTQAGRPQEQGALQRQTPAQTRPAAERLAAGSAVPGLLRRAAGGEDQLDSRLLPPGADQPGGGSAGGSAAEAAPARACWKRRRPWWTVLPRRCSAISATGPGRSWRGGGSGEGA